MKLVLDHITFAYGASPLLSDFSISFEQEGLTMIIGRNGSGKSTLLRLIANLLKPKTGNVLLNGVELSSQPSRTRAQNISWLGQNGTFENQWPLFDFVLSGRYPYTQMFSPFTTRDREVAHEVIATLGLGSLAERSMNTLSGGERQLARIARALAQQAPILLLDEPFSSLDIRHRADLWREIIKPQRTTIAVTHDLALIGKDCRRLVLLDQGKIIADGQPDDVLTPSNLASAFGWTPPPNWSFRPFPF